MKKVLSKILSIVIIIILVGLVCFAAYITFKPNEEHEHTYSEKWSFDSEYHWHAATCKHDVTLSKEKHDFDEGEETTTATDTEHGEIKYTCQTCGSVKTNIVHNYEKQSTVQRVENGDLLYDFVCSICQDKYSMLEHPYSATWSVDALYHWYAATCDHDVVTKKDLHNFEGSNTCTVCKFTTELELDIKIMPAGSSYDKYGNTPFATGNGTLSYTDEERTVVVTLTFDEDISYPNISFDVEVNGARKFFYSYDSVSLNFSGSMFNVGTGTISDKWNIAQGNQLWYDGTVDSDSTFTFTFTFDLLGSVTAISID